MVAITGADDKRLAEEQGKLLHSHVVAAIPAFNEENKIAKVIVLAMKHVDQVLVCDDGSTDATGDIAESLGAKVIKHNVNQGKGAALSDLFIAANRMSPEVLVTIDADGQHDPNEIPLLVEAVRKGADVVVGSRASEDIPFMRRIGNGILNSVAMTGIKDTQSGFRAYNGRRIAELVPSEMGMGADSEILTRAKAKDMKLAEVPVSVVYHEESSTHNPVYHGIDVFLSMAKQASIRHPLIFYGIPGLISLMISLGFWWWTFASFAEHGTIITNVALIAVGTTVVGLILMAVGTILWVLISVVREKSR